MERRGFNQREAAEHFGWDETFVSRLLADGARHQKPGLDNAIKIERETGIPVEAWVSSELDKVAQPVTTRGGKRRQDIV